MGGLVIYETIPQFFRFDKCEKISPLAIYFTTFLRIEKIFPKKSEIFAVFVSYRLS